MRRAVSDELPGLGSTKSLLHDAMRRPLGMAALLGVVVASLACVLGLLGVVPQAPRLTTYGGLALLLAAALFLVVVIRISRRRRVRLDQATTAVATCERGAKAGLQPQRANGAPSLPARPPNGTATVAEDLRRQGHLARMAGELAESRRCYLIARQRFREAGDRYGEAATLLDLGQVEEAEGKLDAARNAYAEARKVLRDIAGRL